MSLGLPVNEIRAVLLADRWHEVEGASFTLDAYEFFDGETAIAKGDGQIVSEAGFMFRETGGQIVAGPLSSIIAVRIPRASR
jgi:hypothetical protein